jgi:hypothetical protein
MTEAKQTVALQELEGPELVQLIQQVARLRESVTLILEDGSTVEMRPGSPLKPLPTLEGAVPPGWKDAVYGPGVDLL